MHLVAQPASVHAAAAHKPVCVRVQDADQPIMQ